MLNLRFIQVQMMLTILSVLSNEKVRLYASNSKKLSSHKKKLPTWYSSQKGASKRHGENLVYVDIPLSLLGFVEKNYNSILGSYVYVLKGSALRFAKRSCR
jgi:hypothetical protein